MRARAAAHAGKATRQVCAVQILVNDLADDRAPEAILVLVGIVINALEALKVILDERIQRGVARISGVINACRLLAHSLRNRLATTFCEKS